MSTRYIVLTLYAISFFGSFGNPLLVPLMPSLMREFQVSAVEVTTLVAVYSLPGTFLIPVLGILQDSLGRKPIVLLSLGLCVAASVGMSLAESFHALVLWRTLQGLAATPLEAMVNTLFSDTFSGVDRVTYIGRNTSVQYIGSAVFPLLSSAVLVLLGWRFAFLIPAVLGIPLFFLALRIPMKKHPNNFCIREYFHTIRSSLFSHLLQVLLLVRMLSAFLLFGSIHSYLTTYLAHEMGASANAASLLFSLCLAGQAVGCMGISAFYRKFSILQLAMGSSVLIILGMAGIVFLHSLVWLAGPLFLIGIGFGGLTALTTTQVAACVREVNRGAVMSFYSSIFRAAQTLAPLLFGTLFAWNSFDAVYQGALVGAVILIIVVFYSYRLAQDSHTSKTC